MITQRSRSLTPSILLLLIFLLAGCGEGSSGFVPLSEDEDEKEFVDITMAVGAVKGPIAFSEISLYQVDLERDRFANYNDTVDGFFRALAELGVRIDSGELILPSGSSSSAILSGLQAAFSQGGYATELDYFKYKISKVDTVSEAKAFLDIYLGVENEAAESSFDTGLLQPETNTITKDRVKNALSDYADLASFKRALDEVEGFFDELAEAESYGEVQSIINRYSASETQASKTELWTRIKATLSTYRAAGSSSSTIVNTFETVAFAGDGEEPSLIDVALSTNDQVANDHLKTLRDDLVSSLSPQELKDLLYTAQRKEGNEAVKQGLRDIYNSIVTYKDFVSFVRSENALYSLLGLRELVLDAESLDEAYSQARNVLEQEAEPAFTDSLINEETVNNGPKNRIAFGVSAQNAQLHNLQLGQYRGFIFIDTESSDAAIDLNSGEEPILSRMSSIIHTDDILGYGDNSRFDESLYFVKNGIVQRDENDELITDPEEVDFDGFDELFAVVPTKFATPLTSLVVDMSRQSIFDLSYQSDFLSPDSDYPDLSLSQKANRFRLVEDSFTDLLIENQKVVASAFNVTSGADQTSFFNDSPIILQHMKHFPDLLDKAFRYRTSVEYYGALLASISKATNLPVEEVQRLLVVDYSDGQLDAKKGKDSIPEFATLDSLKYFGTRHPNDAIIPDTELKVSEIGTLFEQEFSQIVLDQSFEDYDNALGSFEFVAATGGSDIDGDGLLDNDDPDPHTPNDNGIDGYNGLRAVQVSFPSSQVIPLSSSLSIQIPVEQLEGTGGASGPECSDPNANCIVVGDLGVDIETTASVVNASSTSNARVTASVNGMGDGRELDIQIDSTSAGDFTIYVRLTSPAQEGVIDTDQSFDFEIPVSVFDFSSIDFRIVTTSNTEGAGEANPGESLVVQFKATKEVCESFGVCEYEQGQADTYLDLSLLGSSFGAEFYIEDDDKIRSYQQSFVTGLDSEVGSVSVSNLVEAQFANATLTYQDKGSRIALSQVSVEVVASEANQNRESCPNEKDGLDDVNGDGVIDELDSPSCFSEIIESTTTETEVQLASLGESWYFDNSWRFIIRRSIQDDQFLGHIELPKGDDGLYRKVSHVLHDSALRRVYIAYDEGAIGYYAFDTESVNEFYEADSGELEAWQLLGENVVAKWNSGNAQIINAAGELTTVSLQKTFPTPGVRLTPSLGEVELSDTGGEIEVEYSIERFSNQETSEFQARLASDSVSLESGQTLFGDTLTLSLTMQSAIEGVIEYTQDYYLVDSLGFSFASSRFDEITPPVVNAAGLDLSADRVSDTLYVKWYLNNISTDELEYSFSDKDYPYTYESSNFQFGDIVAARIYLRKSQDYSEEEDVLLASLESVFLGTLSALTPVLDTEYWDDNLDLANANIKARLLPGTDNDDFFTLDRFTPTWFINGIIVPGENSFEFPQNQDIVIKFGDDISVRYEININNTTTNSQALNLPSVDIELSETEFSITPLVAPEGEPLSLDMSKFNELALFDFEARWFINGERDFSVKTFTYPAEKLNYGDEVQLLIGRSDDDDTDDRETPTLSYENAYAFVGLNLSKIRDTAVSFDEILDSDGDGIPNYRDYFRFDKNCAVAGEGSADDLDLDGLTDIEEVFGSASASSKPSLADSDGDGLSDQMERSEGTLPLVSDTDEDGYTDGFEFYWGSDPLDDTSPGIIDDSDFDGLSDEEELVQGTLVNSSDTDGDGLEDGLEIRLGTDPTSVDFDNDFLSDGLEVKITMTDPLAENSDEDALSDGVEVALTYTSPRFTDTDNDGTPDHLEQKAIDSAEAGIYEVLFPGDLQSYDSNLGLADISQGTCFTSYLALNEPEHTIVTQAPQVDNASQQEVLFFNQSWPELIRFDASNDRFSEVVSKGEIDARIISASYARENSEELFVGFSDGSIWLADLSGDTPLLSYRFQLPASSRLVSLLDQGEVLIALADNSEEERVLYTFEHSNLEKSPVNSSGEPSRISLDSALWQAPDSSTLWALSEDTQAIIKLEYTSPAVSLAQTEFSNGQSLLGPIYLSDEDASIFVNAANGIRFDVISSSFSDSVYASYVQGVYHQGHSLTAPKEFSGVTLSIGGAEKWHYSKSLVDRDVLALIPVGFNALLISSPEEPEQESNPALVFESLELGDSDGNGLPQWWETLYADGTIEQFNEFEIPASASFSNESNSITLRDDTADEADMDEDGVSNAIELQLGSCAVMSETCPTPADSDRDGLSDLFEYSYREVDGFGNEHTLSLLLSDTDGDGLNDYDEVMVFGTFPDRSDSDGDLICDYIEVTLTQTNPTSNDTDEDGLTDGSELGVTEVDCSGLKTGVVYSDPLSSDSDNDGFNDREELVAGTDPHNEDSDGDGLLDGDEAGLGGDPLNALSRDGSTPDGAIDTDSDGLTDAYELNFSDSSPSNADSDQDGLDDYLEVVTLGSNPNSVDTDGDLICDQFEVPVELNASSFGTSLAIADTDQDGLLDGLELGIVDEFVSCDAAPATNRVSDPLLVDSDEDGLNDKEELDYKYTAYSEDFIANNPETGLYISALTADSDGDLLCDAIEIGISNPGEPDTDFDGLTDAEELGLELTEVYCGDLALGANYTDPLVSDTDGDGLTDGQEVKFTLTNPLDTDSDDDGVLDGDEDTDGDGLSDSVELSRTLTDFDNSDTDGDGISDLLDDQDGDGLSNEDELAYGTCVVFEAINCPNPQDTDGDGVSDFDEISESEQNGTNPLAVDSDDDGLTDSEEIALGTNPTVRDTDLDGIEDGNELTARTDPLNPDSDFDFLADGQDDDPLNPDPDGDFILDGIEVHLLGTNPGNRDSDSDGLLDSEEVWVYGYEGQGHTLLPVGLGLLEFLNSRQEVVGAEAPPTVAEFSADDSGFKSSYQYPTSYDGPTDDDNLEYKFYAVGRLEVKTIDGENALVGPVVDDIDSAIGSIHVRYTSDPTNQDSDGDGLLDFTELMEIEKHFGLSEFDVDPILSGYLEKKSNATNFKVSDPFNADTNDDGISDGDQDADGDFYINRLDQDNQTTSVFESDTDSDGLPDGVEIFVSGSDPASSDTDGDGLFDANATQGGSEIDYEVLFSELESPRVVESDAQCANGEYRISEVAGLDYCINLLFISNPSAVDSDGDGVRDREVDDELGTITDHYPLDKSCHKAADGVANNDSVPFERQCYSSWMAEQDAIGQISSAGWDEAENDSQNIIAFTGEGWGRVIRYQLGVNDSDTGYLKHVDISEDVLISASAASNRLYMANVDGVITYQDFFGEGEQEPEVQSFATVPVGGESVSKLISVGTRLVVVSGQTGDAETPYVLWVYNESGSLLGGPFGVTQNILPETVHLSCDNEACDSAVELLFMADVQEHDNFEVHSVQLDLSSPGISNQVSSNAFAANESPASGPIELSADGASIYLGSGQVLERSTLTVPANDSTLTKTFGQAVYNEFSDLKEVSSHFVALVHEQSPLYDTEFPISVFVEENLSASLEEAESVSQEPEEAQYNKYLLKQVAGDEQLLKVLPQRVNGKDDVAFLSKFESLVDITPLGITDQDSDGMPGIFELVYGLDDSDPSDKFGDLDDDGLTNIEEYLFGTDPSSADTDQDGVSDFQEAHL